MYCPFQMDIEKDVCSKMLECQNEIAPKHIAKHTIEDDIGMVHEITQVCDPYLR